MGSWRGVRWGQADAVGAVGEHYVNLLRATGHITQVDLLNLQKRGPPLKQVSRGGVHAVSGVELSPSIPIEGQPIISEFGIELEQCLGSLALDSSKDCGGVDHGGYRGRMPPV